MQNILNKKDRTDAFFKFLFFFLVTVALVVAAAFFNFKVPEKHYGILKTQALISEQRDHFQKDFVEQANKIYYSMDTLSKEPANFDQLSGDIKLNLGLLYNKSRPSPINEETSPADQTNALVFDALFKLKELYDQNHKLKLELEKLKGVQAELQTCKTDLADCRSLQATAPTQ